MTLSCNTLIDLDESINIVEQMTTSETIIDSNSLTVIQGNHPELGLIHIVQTALSDECLLLSAK